MADAKKSFDTSCGQEAYQWLMRAFRRYCLFNSEVETIDRHRLAYAKPGALDEKIIQINHLSGEMQEILRDPELAAKLDTAEAGADKLDKLSQRQLQAMRRIYTMETALDPEDAAKAKEIEVKSRPLHTQWHQSGDWESAKAHLTEVIDFKRLQGQKLAEQLGCATPYEALLQIYNPGSTENGLQKTFETLVPQLKDIAEKAREKQGPKPDIFKGSYPPTAQLDYLRKVLADCGMDRERGELVARAISNAIEGGTPNEAIAVIGELSNDPAELLKKMKTAIHEGFHEIDYQGRPHEIDGVNVSFTPVAMNYGTDCQEAWAVGGEMIWSRTRAFCDHLAWIARHYFGNEYDGHGLDGETIHKLRTYVEPGPERKDADEVTYHLHIAIRFDIERRLVNGELEVEDLPGEWARLHEEYLGIDLDNPEQSLLQDVHWYVGKFGYYPAYTLGHMIWAQMDQAMRTELGNDSVDEDLRRGTLGARMIPWMHDTFASRANLAPRSEILIAATGRDLSPDAMLGHLRSRYVQDDYSPAMVSAHSSGPAVPRPGGATAY